MSASASTKSATAASKKSLIDEYFEFQIEYEKRYGPKTLILMQVGSFFEFYGVDNETEKIGNARIVADLLNIQLSRRDKAILENSRKNAQMGGVPIGNVKKYLNLLIANQYTVVMIEQVTPPPEPIRKITHIYSPSTYIEECNTPDSNIAVCVFLSEATGLGGRPQFSCGMCAMDITTGVPYVYHATTIAVAEDKMAVMEDIYRFVENFNPKEIIFASHGLKTITEKMIGDVLNTSPYRTFHSHFNRIVQDSNHLKLGYLNAVLEKIYPNHGILSGMEYVHLERYTDTAIALVIAIQWIYDHDPAIIDRIKLPHIYEYHKHLILYHNAAYQLNLVPVCSPGACGVSGGNGSIANSASKYRSLFDIINKTSTAMGRRLLKIHLLNPLTDIAILQERYQKIEWMSVYYKEVEGQLNLITDIERLHRKMALKMLNPQDFSTLYYTYTNIRKILSLIPVEHLAAYQITPSDVAKYDEYITFIHSHVDVNEMGKYNLSDIRNSFFKPGTYEIIDTLQEKIREVEKFMLDECAAMSAAVKKVDGTAVNGGDAVKLEDNDREGYYMTTTARRFELLPPAIKSKYTATKGVGSGVRISNDTFREKSVDLVTNRIKIALIVREKYLEFKEHLTTKYGDMMDKIIRLIAEVDVVKSHRRCANEYGYHRPTIEDQDDGDSYVRAMAIRHPIIEVIEEKRAYITNDVELGQKCRGFLLYGVNGVGKSSLSKAVGINIIMAQMGMYVPSREFHYYPFTKLFTRINGDDNIFKGMSSFVVEMNELRSILKYSDSRSIVLGDEVCKGTEETSALAIVASTIMRFSERNINFILATHFHKLTDLLNCPEKGRRFPNIAFKHLSITIDPRENTIIYGRKLMDGVGSTNYGVEIARFILEDMEFMRGAKMIRDEILEMDGAIIAPTTSNYNKGIYLDCCAICGKTGQATQLDTHHIVEQHEFNEHRLHEGLDIRRDAGHNLVVLCKNHHDAVHHGNLVIRGYKDTVKGRVLDYHYQDPIPPSPPSFPSSSSPFPSSNLESDNQTVMSDITGTTATTGATTSTGKSGRKKYNEEVVALVRKEGERFKDQLNQVKIVQSVMNMEHKMVIPTQIVKKMLAGLY